MAANRKSASGGKTKSAGGAKAKKTPKAGWQMYCPGSKPGSGGIVTCHPPMTRRGCCKIRAGEEEQ